MIDLSKDSNPKHYRFVDEDGTEHEVTDIEFDEDEEEDGLAYEVFFKDDDGDTDSYWVARNGDSKGLDGTLSYVGHLIKNSVPRIYDFGSVEVNPHDIQIHYEDMGDTVELTDIKGILDVNGIFDRFGRDWFDKHYRYSTPKVDTSADGQTLSIQVGACDYQETEKTILCVGETYDKEEFMGYMKIVQEAAQNLSRLRKEFG